MRQIALAENHSPVFAMASNRVFACSRTAHPARSPDAGGRSPIQSITPTTNPVLSVGPKAGTVMTRPQAKRPDGSGTAKNWPGSRWAFDFGVKG